MIIYKVSHVCFIYQIQTTTLKRPHEEDEIESDNDENEEDEDDDDDGDGDVEQEDQDMEGHSQMVSFYLNETLIYIYPRDFALRK